MSKNEVGIFINTKVLIDIAESNSGWCLRVDGNTHLFSTFSELMQFLSTWEIDRSKLTGVQND